MFTGVISTQCSAHGVITGDLGMGNTSETGHSMVQCLPPQWYTLYVYIKHLLSHFDKTHNNTLYYHVNYSCLLI